MISAKRKQILENWQLYALILIPFVYVITFHYVPMLGLQIAFKNYSVIKGIWGSPWIGFDHFQRFFNSYDFKLVIRNTLLINLYNLLIGFPAPIVLALCLNYIRRERYKRAVQLVTYAPHFISVVVLVGIVMQLFSPMTGVLSRLIEFAVGHKINVLGEPAYFKSLYVWSGVWQNIGWGSIIYLAALSSVDPQLHEAAIVDGASKMQRIRHIDIPGILPTIVMLLILEFGKIMTVGFQKVLLLQNPMNVDASEVIDTYVYKTGFITGMPNYSYATAIGLFKSLIGLVLIIAANRIAKKVNDTSLW
ncbi:ABC transporter permease [Paenibacillus sp. UNC451MF]|uniref:ABC transporter permease n=1 Tax=Paenibacillus sp. UNC451MF TaxID=1449063 RepID=UPI00048B6540|nr:ABC transporter permease subunit [Paenibacillus sp. UNC451MF]